MSQPNRLASGGRINREAPIIMRFNGQEVPAYEGDTAASALLANGIHLVGRSFKYHRPRGILAAGSEEPNALLDVDRGRDRRDPNNRATMVEVFDGLAVRSQNHWPSLTVDVGEVNNLMSPLYSAGFYYKTFMWPEKFWASVYEPIIRRAAGLGSAPVVADPDRYVQQHGHCDVLIVGAGPTGLAAALAASGTGQRVMLCDEQAELGGSLLHDVTSQIGGAAAWTWLGETLETLKRRTNVTLLPRTTAFAYFNHNHIALSERLTDHVRNPPYGTARERLWQVRAKRVVIAAGAHERPLVFGNNDRPGIMLAEALRIYVNRYGVAPGRNVVILTNGASAYRAAIDLKQAGIDVQVIDSRHEVDCGPELSAARSANITVRHALRAVGTRGQRLVKGVMVADADSPHSYLLTDTIACDCIGMSGGWTPSIHMASQSRARMHFDEHLDAFVPQEANQEEQSVGACRGTFDLDACLQEGFAAGDDGGDAALTSAPKSFVGFSPLSADASVKGKAFVDFQNDVTNKDIRQALREGFESIEHVKRYTTTGMATDQGKTSNISALSIVAAELGRRIPDVGTTTFRPPYTPVTFGAFAGQNRAELFDPIRVTPTHDWAVANGAVFEDVGLWKRAWYFPQSGEDMERAVRRECLAVRSSVGLLDASTLGKIEVVGPDAAEFLNRIYTNAWTKLVPGRCRYGLMLKEDGFIFDDGVVARLAQDRFHVTTTTGGAPRVLAHMEDYLQTEWPDLKVFLTSATEQWAVIAVQGPKARQTIAPLVDDIDLSDEAFPHMSARSTKICGIESRLFRVSFTGEPGFEINVPADYGASLWSALMDSGRPYGVTPYGTEAMHVLRAEKGFIIVGQETDGTVTPADVGLSGLVSKTKPDFVGKRSLARPDLLDSGRKQLVGLETEDPDLVLDEGAQVVADADQDVPYDMLGHVTSSYYSANCRRSIALALIAGGRDRIGTTLSATTPDGFARAKIVAANFLKSSEADNA
ncbi:MAG: sarcosine oxidase subunit alpha family protein [Hyphomicrobiaceae bacterium]